MERLIYSALCKWKESKSRKPLILEGARQVGKTFILKEFGRREFAKFVYINCDNAAEPLKSLFYDYDIPRIIRTLGAISGISITPGDTLIVLDEIQELTGGLGGLKYFCENAPQYHLAVAGSLLGIALHPGTSFPVGKVDMLKMYPLGFAEFLLAAGKGKLWEIVKSRDWPMVKSFGPVYTELLRQYYFTGGMPEVVASFVENNDIWAAREIQNRILSAYENDFSKHAPIKDVPKIKALWNSLPAQLAKENKKFIYGAVRPGARAREYEVALQWLIDCGLIHRVARVTKPDLPLKFYEDIQAFKLFILDVGLLGAMTGVEPKQVLTGDSVFKEYKGAFTENYVLQQLVMQSGIQVNYFSKDNSSQEIDFIIQWAGQVIPLEVKAEINTKAKSFTQFLSEHPALHGWRFSLRDMADGERITDFPLYALEAIF